MCDERLNNKMNSQPVNVAASAVKRLVIFFKGIGKCKGFNHKWAVYYVGGRYGDKRVRFVGAACKKCGFGRKELIDSIEKQDERYFGTSSPEYWREI